MTTFVLVHGSFGGAWCWNRVRPVLAAAGHDVHVPTLTGLSERAHVGVAETGLSTHVMDVVELIRYEDLNDVVLVGHSYGGMVTTGVAAEVPERIRRLVYLDAFLPGDGESAFDQLPFLRNMFGHPSQAMPWGIPVPDFAALGVGNQEDAAWLAAKSTPMPIETHTQPSLGTVPRGLGVTYVLAGSPSMFHDVGARVENAGHTVIRWPESTHMLPVTEVDAVVELLLKSAE